MSNAGSLGQRDFRSAGDEELVGCSTSAILISAFPVTFGDVDAGADHPVPRFLTAQAAGTMTTIGWHGDDIAIARTVAAGQTIHHRPYQITAASGDIIAEY
jgi:hypothetical protein